MNVSSENSIASIGPNAGIPNLNTASIPASVRDGNAEAKQAYTEGLAFEQVLVSELTTQMSNMMQSSSSDSSDGSSSSGGLLGGSGASAYSSLFPQALTGSIMSGGGLGMAQEIAAAIDPSINDPGSSATAGSPSTTQTGANGGSEVSG
jgi:hypothetical protein